MNFILLQRRFDASCIIFKLQVRTIRITFTITYYVNGPCVRKQINCASMQKLPNALGKNTKLEIHACSNPSPLTKSMQLYFRNYMKYLHRLLS